MAKSKTNQEVDHTTEEKIKQAARTMFHKKGFSATRTRDIAEEAGINLALLNYYFRSKEKLFDIIMLETMQEFLRSILQTLNDENTSLEEKIEAIANNYIDLLTKEPDIPLFIMSELKANPNELLGKMGIKDVLMGSHFIRQYHQGIQEGKIAPVHPLHFMMNLMGLLVFPFIASPMLKGLGNLSDTDFNDLIQQRKTLIPTWMGAIMKGK
ncbi:MAG: TetR/AcrR family transcriptional regulator [Ferruginibacter sp.]